MEKEVSIVDSASLFTKVERDSHQKTEQGLIAKAKQGAFGGLLDFWDGKKTLFIKRAIERYGEVI